MEDQDTQAEGDGVMRVRGSVVGVLALVVALPVSPGQAETTVEVPIQVSSCSSCEVFAQGIDEFGDFWDQAVRLRNGVGAFQVPVTVPDFQVSVQKGRYFGYDNSSALIVMAYRGEAVGSPISNRRSRTSKAGFVCLPTTAGVSIRAKVRLVKTPKYPGWRTDPLFKRKYVRAWASPTLPSEPSRSNPQGLPLSTKKGAIAVQNVICGSNA